MVDAGEVALERGEQVGPCPALEDLGDEVAARLQHARGEVRRGLAESGGAEVVGLAMAGGRRRHVGEHDVGRWPPSAARIASGASSSRKSFRSTITPGSGVHVEVVDGDDPRIGLGRAHPLGGDLRPAARRGAEVDDTVAAA